MSPILWKVQGKTMNSQTQEVMLSQNSNDGSVKKHA
jgi:hypothetical protein